MGPRTYIRGNTLERPRSILPSCLASMGPRTYIRGNNILTFILSLGLHASMGPRTYIRGNEGLVRLGVNESALLQWGRGLTSAEMRRALTCSCRRLTSINGAADLHPPKCGAPTN